VGKNKKRGILMIKRLVILSLVITIIAAFMIPAFAAPCGRCGGATVKQCGSYKGLLYATNCGYVTGCKVLDDTYNSNDKCINSSTCGFSKVVGSHVHAFAHNMCGRYFYIGCNP